MIRRFVENREIRLSDKELRKRDPTGFTTGKGIHKPTSVGDPQIADRRFGLVLPVPSAVPFEFIANRSKFRRQPRLLVFDASPL